MKKINRTIIDGKQHTDNVTLAGKHYRIDIIRITDGESDNPVTDTTVRMAETDGYDGKVIGPFETYELI